MKNFLILVGLLLLPLSVFAGVGTREGYGNGVQITAATLDGSATQVPNISSTATVSSTAMSLATINHLVAFTCDQLAYMAIVSGAASSGPIVLTSATGYPMQANAERTLMVPASSTVAFLASSTTANCWQQPLKR